MARWKNVSFQVSGHRAFPTAMLPYDQCWPETERDAQKMDEEGLRTITMLSTRDPTQERWASFGWIVNPKSIRRY